MPSCPKSKPSQLNSNEVYTIRELITGDEYRHVPTTRLSILAQRMGKVHASASTWLRLMREHVVKEHLCMDKGYDSASVRGMVQNLFDYIPHVRGRGEEKKSRRNSRHRARRWVVERTHSWMNRFRAILVRWDKKVRNNNATLHLACAYITFKRAQRPVLRNISHSMDLRSVRGVYRPQATVHDRDVHSAAASFKLRVTGMSVSPGALPTDIFIKGLARSDRTLSFQ
jgi:transposase